MFAVFKLKDKRSESLIVKVEVKRFTVKESVLVEYKEKLKILLYVRLLAFWRFQNDSPFLVPGSDYLFPINLRTFTISTVKP